MKKLMTCDECEARYVGDFRPARPNAPHYCSRECAQKKNRKGAEVLWLRAATEPDEKYLVQNILLKAAAMQRVPQFSKEWDRLDIEHSLLLDVTRDILWIRGKLPPSWEGEPWERGYDEDA